MGLFDFFKGGGDKGGGGGQPIQPRPDYGYKSAGELYSWANDYKTKYPYDPAKPYSGELTAPRTETQDRGQGILNTYLDQPMYNDSFKAARDTTLGTLDGSYDPRTSPYYKSMKDQIMRDQKEASDAVMHRQAQTGMLHSDPTGIQMRKLAENTSGQLATLLGGLYENDRNRQMKAIPYATALGTLEDQIPLNRVQAAETLGAMPQQQEQSTLDRLYNEYLRQQSGAREPLNIYEGLTGRSFGEYAPQPYYPSSGVQQYANSTGNMLGSLLPLIMSFGSN